MNMLFGGIRNLALCLTEWLWSVFNIPSPITWTEVFLFISVILVLLFSGAVAAHVAEDRGWAPKKHFFLAVLLPGLYPLLLALILKPQEGSYAFLRRSKKLGEKEKKAAAAAAKEEEKRQIEEAKAANASNTGAWSQCRLEQFITECNQSSYSDILCKLKDGREVHVIRFLEAQAQVAVMEVSTNREGETTTIRFPYDRFESIQKINN